MKFLKDLSIETSNSQATHKEYEPEPYPLSRETPTLETQNNELQKLNAELHAYYKAAQATISELQAEKSAYAKRNTKLEGAIADACNAIDGFVGSCTPAKTYDEVCAESWDRNKIVDVRVPIRSINADTDTRPR
ncbi:uncharacterized protein N7496_011064 [Penicillium cataractarum]|uniref:Uncharacterized protein n=1 Tax=Penicillium cataractarum TaxID=2100454 RepID=A0A9W9REF4_9EURO|nr:uncharacterized protein N7496_011064 [Penicillium cataractarum]KAJ5358651.1 hypothetical protein N7496_011064 [Penicillium cataractarum]